MAHPRNAAYHAAGCLARNGMSHLLKKSAGTVNPRPAADGSPPRRARAAVHCITATMYANTPVHDPSKSRAYSSDGFRTHPGDIRRTGSTVAQLFPVKRCYF